MKKKRLIIGLLIAGTIIIALWASTMLIAVTDRAYICENTGSKKGHREWFFGVHTNAWYRKSELERFMEVAHPNLLKHRWTCFMGDGRSLIPGLHSSRHGRPGPILHLDSDVLDHYVSSLSDIQRVDLYKTFSNDDEDTLRMKIDSIYEAIIQEAEQGMTPNGP